MTLTDLAAAIWDQREIEITHWYTGKRVRCVPKGVERMIDDDGSVEWRVTYYELPQGPTACLYAVLDAFDGHSGET